MAASTGILLTAGAITFGNEWVHGHVNWRIPVATLGAAVIFAGMERVPGGQPFAVGVATIALIGVLVGGVTPGVPSPAAQLLAFVNGQQSPQKPATGGHR